MTTDLPTPEAPPQAPPPDPPAAPSSPPPAPPSSAVAPHAPKAPPLASMVGVWANADRPKKPREAASAVPVVLCDVRIELTENVVLGLLGGELDGAGLLVDVFSGRARRARGAVLVAGRDPQRDAATRARVGVLSPWSATTAADLPIARDVLGAVVAAMSIRTGAAPDAAAARALLADYGLAALADRATDALSVDEARGVELALALSTPSPALLLLSEPFTRVGAIDLGVVRRRIAERGKEAPVVVTSSSVTELRAVARDVVVLRRGALVTGGAAAELLDGKGRAEVHVWLASRARDTLRALLDTEGVVGAAWERREEPASEASAGAPGPEGDVDAGVLRVQHTSMEALGLAIADAVVKTAARVVSMREVVPSGRVEAR